MVEHVELAYACTAHRAQGATVDTAHTLVADSTTRETFYVGMSRGRYANTAYVITGDEDEIPDGHVPSVRDVLAAVIRRSGAEVSAHETITTEQDQATSIARLAAEYDTLAREAATHHWASILNKTCPADTDPATSPSYPDVVTAMRRADAHGLDPAILLPRLASRAELQNSGDPLALLGRRLEQITDHAPPPAAPRRHGR